MNNDPGKEPPSASVRSASVRVYGDDGKMLIKLKSADDRFSFRAVAQRVQVRRKGQPVDGLYYVHLMHLDSDGGAWQSAVDIYPDWLMITPRRVYRFAGLRVDFEIDGKIVPYATLTAYMQQLKQAQRRGEAIPEKSFRDVQLFTEGMELAIGVDPAALLYFASKMEELAEDGSDVEVATTMHFVAIWEAIDMSPGVDAEHTLEISARTVATFDESEKITRTEGGRKRSVAGRPILAFEGGYVSVRDHPGVKREQAQAAKKTHIVRFQSETTGRTGRRVPATTYEVDGEEGTSMVLLHNMSPAARGGPRYYTGYREGRSVVMRQYWDINAADLDLLGRATLLSGGGGLMLRSEAEDSGALMLYPRQPGDFNVVMSDDAHAHGSIVFGSADKSPLFPDARRLVLANPAWMDGQARPGAEANRAEKREAARRRFEQFGAAWEAINPGQRLGDEEPTSVVIAAQCGTCTKKMATLRCASCRAAFFCDAAACAEAHHCPS